jgi:hypothetical protein
MDERETQRSVSVKDATDSLAPIQLERLSVEEEVALMGRGRGKQLAGIAAVALVSVLGGVLWMKGMDAREAYASAATRLGQLDRQHGYAFMYCALPGIPQSQIDSRENLHTAIEHFGEQYGKSYARNLRRCAPTLDEMAPALAALQVPENVSSELHALRTAAANLKRAWNDYRGYLEDPKRPYDYVQAVPLIEKITLGWEAYEQRESELHTALLARQ